MPLIEYLKDTNQSQCIHYAVIDGNVTVRCELSFGHGRHHTVRVGEGHFDWVDGIDRRVKRQEDDDTYEP